MIVSYYPGRMRKTGEIPGKHVPRATCCLKSIEVVGAPITSVKARLT
jgi:hypothetical protein